VVIPVDVVKCCDLLFRVILGFIVSNYYSLFSAVDVRCGFRWDLWLTLFEVPVDLALVGRVWLWEYLLNPYQADERTSRAKARVSI